MMDLPSCHAPKNYDHLQWNENRSSDSILLPQSPFQQKGSSNAFMPENEFENKPFNELIPNHDARKKNNKDIKNRNNDESITNSKNISTKGRFKISRSPHRFSIQVLSRNSDNSSFNICDDLTTLQQSNDLSNFSETNGKNYGGSLKRSTSFEIRVEPISEKCENNSTCSNAKSNCHKFNIRRISHAISEGDSFPLIENLPSSEDEQKMNNIPLTNDLIEF